MTPNSGNADYCRPPSPWLPERGSAGNRMQVYDPGFGCYRAPCQDELAKLNLSSRPIKRRFVHMAGGDIRFTVICSTRTVCRDPAHG